MMISRETIMAALLRPGMYTGDRGNRAKEQWQADAVLALLTGPRPVEMK